MGVMNERDKTGELIINTMFNITETSMDFCFLSEFRHLRII